MKLKPEHLEQDDYTLLDTLEHNEFVPFVTQYLQKKTLFSTLYYLSLFVTFTLLIFFCGKYYKTAELTFAKEVSMIVKGIFITLLLIPVHELIHAIAYKKLGAEKISFDVDFKKFVFLAIADRFVASKRELRFVALAPFVSISLVLIVLTFFAPPQINITLLVILFAHSALCSGDLALCSYFSFYKYKEIVTYDDRTKKASYFYEKTQKSVTTSLAY